MSTRAALGKLSRYENSIERSLHRCLAELRRHQEARQQRADEQPDGASPIHAAQEDNLPNEPNSAASSGPADTKAAERT